MGKGRVPEVMAGGCGGELPLLLESAAVGILLPVGDSGNKEDPKKLGSGDELGPVGVSEEKTEESARLGVFVPDGSIDELKVLLE